MRYFSLAIIDSDLSKIRASIRLVRISVFRVVFARMVSIRSVESRNVYLLIGVKSLLEKNITAGKSISRVMYMSTSIVSDLSI